VKYLRFVDRLKSGVKFSQTQLLYNILYIVSTQQHQYSNIMYAIGYIVKLKKEKSTSLVFILISGVLHSLS